MPQDSYGLGVETIINRLSPAGDRLRIDAELESFLSAAQRRFASNPHLEPIYERMSAFVLRGGKRVRPRLCLASCRILSGDEPARPCWAVAASLELFHAFMLVHDDLIDGSVARREAPTLHEAIRLEGGVSGDAKVASDLALLAGDWLFALGLRMIGRSGLDDAIQGRAQRFLADMLFETGVGESLDVLYGASDLGRLSEPQIVEAYIRKTSRYSVSGPLVLGAILAGAAPAHCRALGRFGDLLGLGYQVRNDLEALRGAPEQACDDLDTGKRTLVLWTAYRDLDTPGRTLISEALELPAGSEKRAMLYEAIDRSGAMDACRRRVRGLQRQAAAALRESAFTVPQRRMFLGLAGWLSGGMAGEVKVQAAQPVLY